MRGLIAAGVILLGAAVGGAGEIAPEVDGEGDGAAFFERLLDGFDAISWDPAEAGEGDACDLLEELLREAAALREHPIDVNTASISELLRVPGLDPATAAAIVEFRLEHGPVAELEDLVRLGPLEPDVLAALRPYVVATPSGARAISHQPIRPKPGASVWGAGSSGRTSGVAWNLRVRASCRADSDDDWSISNLDGVAAGATYARLRVSHASGLSLGAVCEKDAGEGQLLDHTAFFLRWDAPDTPAAPGAYRLSGVVGDFTADWAQGLVLRGGRFASVSSYPHGGGRVRGYDGVSEVIARRGVWVEVSRGAARAQALWARTRLDAAIGDDGLVESIRSSGHHRTDGELAGANALTESLVGARTVLAAGDAVEIGGTLLRFGFDPPIGPGDAERQHFRYRGSELTIAAGDVAYRAGAWRVGAEAAWSSAGGRAALAAVRLKRGRSAVRLGLGLLSREYWCPLGGGVPGISGGTNGTVGWIGAAYGGRAWKSWVDLLLVGRPWRSYHNEFPDGSHRVTVGAEMALGGVGRVTVETRARGRTEDAAGASETSESTFRRTKVVLKTAGRSPVSFFALRASSDVDGVQEGRLSAFGVRARGEIAETSSLTVGATSVTKRGRIDSIVQYEPRLPGEFGLRSLNASGTRWYIRLQVGLSFGAGITVRLAGGPGSDRIEFGIGIDARG